MSRIAHEVSRRMTPEYAKERAREMARDRMYKARDRAVESSWFAPLLGAGIGALVAKTLQSRAQERGWYRDEERLGYRGDFERRAAYRYPRGSYSAYEYDEYGAAAFPEETFAPGGEERGETSAKLSEKAAEVKERARETTDQLKERARETADQMKGRIQETTDAMRQRLPDRARIRASTHEDTGLWALGAMALGALFGFALPESRRERELLEPARRKARELGQQARDKAIEQGSAALEKATEKVGAAGEQRPPQAGAPPSPDMPGALH